MLGIDVKTHNEKLAEAVRKQEKKKMIDVIMPYWPLLESGLNQVDTKKPKQVKLVQRLLKGVGYYGGNEDGKYGPQTDEARWRFVKDMMKDPDFSFALIKTAAFDISNIQKDLDSMDLPF